MVVTGFITLLLLIVGPGHGEANVKSYPRIEAASQRDRILIIAPHIDDESIGAAGYAADAIANGADVYVAFLTAGDCNLFSALLLHRTLGPTSANYLSVGRTRIGEAKAAMKMLGVPEDHYFILGYPDQGLRAILDNRHDVIRSRATKERSVPYREAMSPGSPYSYDSLMSDMERVVETARPTTVIAPVRFDLHPDHAASAEITDLTLENLHLNPQRLGYLVHSAAIPSLIRIKKERALKPPSGMRSLTWATYPLTSAVQKQKDAILQTYKSQRPYTSILRNTFVRTNELFFVQAALPLHADLGARSDRPQLQPAVSQH
jgi:LmbE family N-acetylglucosaminyl deacetylase